ncbi:MAG: alkaline phosphatase D family protein [Saprospiraceae bacterium]
MDFLKYCCIGFCLSLMLAACQGQLKPTLAQAEGESLFVGQHLPLDAPLSTIAIGSCNKHDEDQSIWTAVGQDKPDLWIWLGDNVYGDTENMEVLKSKYLLQKKAPEYQAFRTQVPVIGVWDDHDYGVNDGGKAYPKKEESQSLLCDFLDVPLDAPVRSQKGIYQAYVFGPAGRQVKIILLDARYFRDELEANLSGPQRYKINPTGDILGEAQWQWLEKELTNSSAQIHLIGSGIQIIPEEQGFEKWANFPLARTRLLRLLATTQPSRPILLSGDRHISEFSKIKLDSLSFPIYEFTSSGLTHAYESFSGEPNKYRLGSVVFQRNYGLIRIDWTSATPSIGFQIRGLKGDLLEELALD